MDILKYKDYEGTAELDMTRGICRGKILFINDLVTYEAALPANLQKEFEAAVNDYIETCAALGREPQKSLKGQFNVRIPQALHKAAVLRALVENLSLNDVVVRALDAFVNAKVDINNHVETKNYYIGTGEFQRAVASASDDSAPHVIYGNTAFASDAITVVSAPAIVPKGNKHAATKH
ncbi:MAG: type II toxin-antitoxin system HicB family antitoxin [Sulfuricella sp.]|nr:type II toxin-antitoxin system HicB family antitoxin [Sulfuricella sp.]